LVATVAILTIISLPSFSEHADVYVADVKKTADGKIVRTPTVVSVERLREKQQAARPIVRVDSTTHDFGRLDPLTLHEHVFVIRNAGDAPLELTEGPTTCKCTLARLGQDVVPPGGKVNVLMQWNTGRDTEYSHNATIYTNDPLQPSVRLTIKGTVMVRFRCEPEQLVFSRVNPGETPTASAMVYSQMWDDFEIDPIVPTLDGLRVTVSDAEASQKELVGARSARRITVQLPGDLPEGYFTSSLSLRGRPVGGTDLQGDDCTLGVEGKVIRRLAIYGDEIDVDGQIEMGRVRQGKGGEVRLLMKLRDPERNLPVTKIEATPDFVQVRVEPYQTEASRDFGLYYLHLQVPADAPLYRLPPNQTGRIRIEFDHPRVKELDLPLDLIVIPIDGV
jgi:hypothetical protein